MKISIGGQPWSVKDRRRFQTTRHKALVLSASISYSSSSFLCLRLPSEGAKGVAVHEDQDGDPRRFADVESILERIRENEEIAKRFFEIEVSILSILDFEGLFERLLSEIREKFGIPCVWISLIDKSEISDLIQTLPVSKDLKEKLNLIDRKTFLRLTDHRTTPLLLNGDLRLFHPMLPKGQLNFIRSLAVSPITLHGEIIGSLNQADFSPLRYRPGMDTQVLSSDNGFYVDPIPACA